MPCNLLSQLPILALEMALPKVYNEIFRMKKEGGHITIHLSVVYPV